MFKWLKGWWRRTLAWLDWARGRSPYGHLPREKIHILGPNGEPLGDSVGALAYVSRHGYHESGVTCPCCGQRAVRAADWSKVVKTSWGEAVFCSCGRMLLASPDDDIDPVSPKTWYDPAIYHTFARPANWEKPRQRTLSRPPVANDWVVIFDHRIGSHDLTGAEGRVVDVVGPVITVALSDGIAGSSTGERHVELPIEKARVMLFDTLRREDRVTVLRGPDAGRVGIVQEFKSGMVDVLIDGTVATIPVERLQPLHE